MGDNIYDDEDDEFENEFDIDSDINNDDKTDDMFASNAHVESLKQEVWQPINSNNPYLVLARKYRPQNFDDLIGQEAMVKTLGNAFKQKRIAHAFMLTGVRGIGKTTTARLIARALNYSAPGHDYPSIDLKINGIHCEAITKGNHPDVIELDAASNTGVDKMRDILENVRYGPTQARYKIYIIDEVHMLSTAAFNALLKTLEEPPPHAKFIFATTETHKVPVTILSRCQRFDLRRLDRETMTKHLENICNKENVKVETEGLAQIARASEGSVRDALSLLDQAIVQENQDGIIDASQVRDMLGLSDRNRIYALIDYILKGDAKSSIIEAREQYDYGASPNNILQSLLEIVHEISKCLILGDEYKFIETQDGAGRLIELSKNTSQLALARLWQMLLTGFDECRRAPDAMQALEMCIIRLCGASKMPSPEDLARMVQNGIPPSPKPETPTLNNKNENNVGGNISQLRPKIKFDDFAQMLKMLESEMGERALVSQLERFARPVRLEDGIVAFEPTKDAPKNLHMKLAAALKSFTNHDWRVYIEENGEQTIEEIRKIENAKLLEKVKQDPKVQNVLKLFPGAKITNIRPLNHNQNQQNIEGNRK